MIIPKIIIFIMGILTILRILAGTYTKFCGKVRYAWNKFFGGVSQLPFCHWLKKFLVKDRTGELLEKAEEIAIVQKKAKKFTKQVKQKEKCLQNLYYKKYGTKDIILNPNGTRVKVKGRDWVDAEWFINQLISDTGGYIEDIYYLHDLSDNATKTTIISDIADNKF